MRWFQASVLFYYVGIVQFAVCNDETLVTTKLGQYRGRFISTINGLQVLGFNGIRYAKPPQRFKDAEMIGPHSGVYDATKDGEDCMQVSHNFNKYPFEESVGKKFVGSEDCLFINVYTPSLNPKKNYPVMLWIHGGGFMIGTGAGILHGPELILEKEVVLVAFNYRLDIFGFLSYDDDVIPGNIGLKDQALAIRWVKENIDAFGGDPQSITIFGESAGSSSVHLQMHSRRSKGLFHRAISQSGTIDCPWPIVSRSLANENALKVAAYLSCPTNPEDLLICLQGKTSEQIMDASMSLKKLAVKMEMIFLPVLENKVTGFITKKDLEARSTIPWMGGVNSGEGFIIYSEMSNGGDKNLSNFNKYHQLIMPDMFSYLDSPFVEKETRMIKKYYLGEKDFSDKTVKQFVDMFSDGMFIYGQLQSVRKHRGKAYLYLLTHESERSLKALNHMQHLNVGVSHADDLFYFFPFWKFFPTLHFNHKDSRVQKLMVELWTNFAIHGHPTPGNTEPKWLESDKGKYYMEISTEVIKQSKNLYSSRMEFWDNLPNNVISYDHLKEEL